MGVSEYYNISKDEGYKKLDKFYNIIYRIFHNNITSNNTKILIFSDSLFITSRQFGTIMKLLDQLYKELIKSEFMLKGAIAEGLLEYDARIQLPNLKKNLPTTDILFRAVGLEKQANGMRLIIEKNLAQKILPEQLYGIPRSYNVIFNNLNYGIDEIRRKIRWTSDISAYDYLWYENMLSEDNLNKPKNIIKKLRKMKLHANVNAQIHYDATIHLIERFL